MDREGAGEKGNALEVLWPGADWFWRQTFAAPLALGLLSRRTLFFIFFFPPSFFFFWDVSLEKCKVSVKLLSLSPITVKMLQQKKGLVRKEHRNDSFVYYSFLWCSSCPHAQIASCFRLLNILSSILSLLWVSSRVQWIWDRQWCKHKQTFYFQQCFSSSVSFYPIPCYQVITSRT